MSPLPLFKIIIAQPAAQRKGFPSFCGIFVVKFCQEQKVRAERDRVLSPYSPELNLPPTLKADRAPVIYLLIFETQIFLKNA
jgi:hypothetical protein